MPAPRAQCIRQTAGEPETSAFPENPARYPFGV
jgi:hypothetical protein